MNKIASEFDEIIQDPLYIARKWKEAGKKVIGCFPMYVPEEIIHAAGMLPVILLNNDEPITLSNRYLQSYLCHVGRSNFDQALKGDLDLLDGIVFPDICDLLQMIPDIWNIHKRMPFQHIIVVAGKVNSVASRTYLKTEFNELKKAIEKFSGKNISDNDLRQSIDVYNLNRDLIHRLYKKRMENPKAYAANNIAAIVMASMLMPKEEHSELLQKVLSKAVDNNAEPDDRVKIFIAGGPCNKPEWKILELIEELEAIVVNDDLYVGRRYFATKVDDETSPIEALAKRYINDIPCPTKFGQEKKYAEHLLDLFKESQAHCVVIFMIKYCEPYSFAYPVVKSRLEQQNIPHLVIDVETPVSLESVRTRLQAFIETLK